MRVAIQIPRAVPIHTHPTSHATHDRNVFSGSGAIGFLGMMKNNNIHGSRCQVSRNVAEELDVIFAGRQ